MTFPCDTVKHGAYFYAGVYTEHRSERVKMETVAFRTLRSFQKNTAM